MGNRIEYPVEEPDIFTVKGVGVVKYYEFENTIWIKDVFSEKRGAGAMLARRFIQYARSVNKSIYGQANPQDNVTKMELDRLTRWYKTLGGEPVFMKGHPTAMKLEIENV